MKRLMVYAFGLAVMVMALSCGSNQAVLNSKVTHVEKKEKLGKGEFYQFEITLEDKMQAIEVSGEWRVTDGGDRKAKVFVMDEENYLNFKEDKPFKTKYDSGEMINHTFKIRLLNQFQQAKTIYYLIIDNPSEEDKKEVEFKLDLDYDTGAGSRD